MNEGLTDVIEYVTTDGRRLTARLLNATWNDGPPTPVRWAIQGEPIPQDWIGYKGGDSNWWWACIHKGLYEGINGPCYYYWFAHYGVGDPGGRAPDEAFDRDEDADQIRMGFFDHEGHGWWASITPARVRGTDRRVSKSKRLHDTTPHCWLRKERARFVLNEPLDAVSLKRLVILVAKLAAR